MTWARGATKTPDTASASAATAVGGVAVCCLRVPVSVLGMPGARRQSPGEDSDEGFCTTQRLVASVAALPTTTKTIHPQQTHHRTQQSALPGNSWSRLLQLAIFGLIFLLAPSTPQRTPHCCCCCCCCFLRVWMPRLTWVRPLRTNQLQQNHPLQHWNAASAAVVVVAFQTPPIAWTRSRNTFARTRATTTARFLSFSAVNTNNTSINSSSSSIGPRNNAMPSTTETIAPPIPPTLSNSALAEQRLEIFRAKRQARQRSIQAVNQRNLQLKNLLLMNPQQQPVEDESELQSAKVSSSSLLVAPEQTPPVLTTGSTIEATLNDGGHSDHGVAAAAASSSSSVLYQVKVLVSEDLRQELKLSGREKRGRVFLEAGSPALSSVPDLYQALHGFFRALKKGSFLLSASYPLSTTTTTTVDGTDSAPREQQQQQKQHTGLLPEVTAEGSTPHSPTNEKSNGESYDESTWFIESDADVVKTFARADDFFASMSSSSSSSASNALDLKRPSIVLHVKKNPNAPPPPPTPPYLLNMPDPSSSTHITMLSFYAFPPAPGIANPNDYATLLRTLWKPFAALGRVYVAHEGINAQMAVPTLVLDNFVQCCYNLPDQVGTCLQSQTSGGVNVDAIPLTRAEFAVAGIPAMPTDPTTTIMSTTPVPPFTNLHIRVRQQVVTDGLDRSYDWENAGK